MKTKKPLFTTALIICILSLIGTLFIYPYLPLEIPVHFNFAGEVDNYGHRGMSFFTAMLPFFMLGLFVIIPKVDPKKHSYEKHSKAYDIFNFTMIIFFIIIHWTSLFVALGINISIHKIVPALVSILFIIIGNYMPQIRQNYTFGMRLPWALENTDNWRYTHRIGGYTFIVSGILIFLGIFLDTALQTILFFIAIVGILVIPTLFSYLYYRRHQNH